MHRKLFTLAGLVIALCTGVAFAGGGNPETANGGAFLHIADNSGSTFDNVTANRTALVSERPLSNTSPMTQSNANAMVFITHNMSETTANQWSPFGVYYVFENWHIFNQNQSNMAGGEAFNVQVQSTGNSVFIHNATAQNSTDNHTRLDHPLLNGNPGALISVTPRWEGTYNAHHIGVYYNLISGRWAIFNQDMAAMPAGASFNVQVLLDPTVDFMHIASSVVSSSMTEIDHPLLNFKSDAQIIVTQNWGSSLNGIYNNNPIGVTYDNATNKWRIANVNGAAMPLNAKFNIHIASTNYFGDALSFNGSFEAGSGVSNKVPAAWNTTLAGVGSKRVCNKYAPVAPKTKTLANTGECAYMLQGAANEVRKISQATPVNNIDGGVAELGVWLRAISVTGLKVNLKVTHANGSKTTVKLPVEQLNGSYDWKLVSNSLLTMPGSDAVKAKVTFALSGTGKVYIDDVTAMVYKF